MNKSKRFIKKFERQGMFMHVSLWQAILIGLLYYLGFNGTPWLSNVGTTVVNRPLVAGTIVGLILGDPVKGCIIGAAINLPYLAYISAGGTISMDIGLAGTVGTAFALISGVTPQVAISMAVPIGLLGTMLFVLRMTVDISFVHMADKAAKEGDVNKVIFFNVVPPQLFLALITVVPVTLIVYFGSGAISTIISSLGGTPLHILTVIGGVLPALGIAMNLKAIGRRGILLFFMIGFISSVYLKLPIIAISIIGFIIAMLYTELSISKQGVA